MQGEDDYWSDEKEIALLEYLIKVNLMYLGEKQIPLSVIEQKLSELYDLDLLFARVPLKRTEFKLPDDFGSS
ncbi:hypothetical protein GJ496_003662 [Pomphorhynchus laevis]|nr:hypothetical protein GJ496_003662 [Pomphorhynchus laevis]